MVDTMTIPIKPFFVAENEALKNKVMQLEKEADWLAEKCEVMSKFAPLIPVSKDEFREEARKAVQNERY